MSLDNAALTVYGDSISGNCLKVKFVADRLGIPYDWVETSVLAKETRTPEFLALNPAGQVPLAVFAGNGPLAQSNAIMLHLAEGSDLKKTDDQIDPALPAKCAAVLTLMDKHLAGAHYFVGEKLSLADIALVAYTRFAHEAGLDLARYPNVQGWVRRIENDLKIEHAQ